jgi:hypothetical protein
MQTKCIHAIPNWRGGPRYYDCVFIHWHNSPPDDTDDFWCYHVACVCLLFTFTFFATKYSCALIHEFLPANKDPDEKTGMWIMQHSTFGHQPQAQVIALDSILHAAHLIPVYRYEDTALPKTHTPDNSLNKFEWFYVNKFIDHHVFEVAF